MRELENEVGCFFDRNTDGSLHGKALVGQTFDRTAQGRPYRHRDHQPADGAGVGAADGGWRNIGRLRWCRKKVAATCGRAVHRRQDRAIRLVTAKAVRSPPVADRRCTSYAIGRQVDGRACDGVDYGAGAARHGDKIPP
ncbi:MAG: hypothetical protein R3D67_15635 [Hyphomicrobiaceae bacterium]